MNQPRLVNAAGLPSGDPDSTVSIEALVAALEAGEPVVLPTDTVYGLAARAGDADAVARLFALKRRPLDRRIAALVADAAQAEDLVELGTAGRRLAEAFWPGGLTIVAPRRAGCELTIGDSRSIGVRCPDQPLVRALAARVGPIAATSANLSGAEVPAEAAEIARMFDSVDFVVDAGPLGAAASTVVSVVGQPDVLRPGPVSAADIEAALASAQPAEEL